MLPSQVGVLNNPSSASTAVLRCEANVMCSFPFLGAYRAEIKHTLGNTEIYVKQKTAHPGDQEFECHVKQSVSLNVTQI